MAAPVGVASLRPPHRLLSAATRQCRSHRRWRARVSAVTRGAAGGGAMERATASSTNGSAANTARNVSFDSSSSATATTVKSYISSNTGATPRVPLDSVSSYSSTISQSSSGVASAVPSSAVDNREERSLSRKNSTDAELIFGDKPAQFYRNKYAYSGYTSQGRSSDVDVIFGKSVPPTGGADSRTNSYKSNTSFSMSGDSDYSLSRDKDFNERSRNFEGIENPVFEDYASPKNVTSTSSSSKPRWSRDDDDDYDLK